MVKISIIIVTFNSAKFIISCLDSVFKHYEAGFEVILVDNASEDGTASLVRKSYPQVKIIENRSNLGASRARNQGLNFAVGEWILTLDCDVILEENFLQLILKASAEVSPGIGSFQPKILDIKKDKIYSAGIRRSFLTRFYDLGRGLSATGRFDAPGPIFGACCAAALYRRKMLEQIKDSHGYFDERFFFLFEDADLSCRAQKKGWSCMYYPEARCYHQGNSSSTDRKSRQILSFRNRQLLIIKNQNPLVIILMFPLYLIYDLPRFLILATTFKLNFFKFYQF
ncbi:MAG: glycosyltransferase family 2 protein [Candidatus Omnitrophota bacterium]